jgi:drug/metabolite transporter (DMT)-like permease
LEIKALTFTYASNVSIILSVAPIFTALLAHYFTKDEKLSGMLFLGSGIAMLGVVLVVFNGTVVLKVNPFGDILSILAAFSWSIYSIILKKLVHKYDPVYITRKVVFYSILTSLPILLMEHKPFPIFEIKTPSVLFNLIFLGVFGSGICYVAWNIAARKLGIVTTNNYIYVSPFITMMAAGIFLHEKVSVMGVIGALFIIAGVITAGLKKTENQENKDDSELNFGEN